MIGSQRRTKGDMVPARDGNWTVPGMGRREDRFPGVYGSRTGSQRVMEIGEVPGVGRKQDRFAARDGSRTGFRGGTVAGQVPTSQRETGAEYVPGHGR